MKPRLIPQEIYWREYFSTPEYYLGACNAWRAMLEHAETMLERFMLHLPDRYRARPLYDQPDITWGETVLPNFRSTMVAFEEGYLELKQGDYRALRIGTGIASDIRGQQMDYPPDWMDEVEHHGAYTFEELRHKAGVLAHPMGNTGSHGWGPQDLTPQEAAITLREVPMPRPSTWPIYRLNPMVQVKTGEWTPVTAFYLPNLDDAAPRRLIHMDDDFWGRAGKVRVEPQGQPDFFEPCTWTLIERVSDSGVGVLREGRRSVSSAATRRHVDSVGGQPEIKPYVSTGRTAPLRDAFSTFQAKPLRVRELFSGTVLYRVLDARASARGALWMSQAEFQKLKSKADWRRGFAAWNTWYAPTEYVTYTIPPNQSLDSWEGAVAPRQLAGTPYWLEGGAIQTLIDPQQIEENYLSHRHPLDWADEEFLTQADLEYFAQNPPPKDYKEEGV
jgi:hypothetical protein